jgi:hypothetical protein
VRFLALDKSLFWNLIWKNIGINQCQSLLFFIKTIFYFLKKIFDIDLTEFTHVNLAINQSNLIEWIFFSTQIKTHLQVVNSSYQLSGIKFNKRAWSNFSTFWRNFMCSWIINNNHKNKIYIYTR